MVFAVATVVVDISVEQASRTLIISQVRLVLSYARMRLRFSIVKVVGGGSVSESAVE